jgi:hypothetical protein
MSVFWYFKVGLRRRGTEGVGKGTKGAGGEYDDANALFNFG